MAQPLSSRHLSCKPRLERIGFAFAYMIMDIALVDHLYFLEFYSFEIQRERESVDLSPQMSVQLLLGRPRAGNSIWVSHMSSRTQVLGPSLLFPCVVHWQEAGTESAAGPRSQALSI